MDGTLALLSSLGISGLLAFWVKQKVINVSQRKFADYKQLIDLQMLSYKTQYDKQILEYKTELSFLNTRLSLLHSKRLEVIEGVFDKLVKLNNAMNMLVSPVLITDRSDGKEMESSLVENMRKTYADYDDFILVKKIYLSIDLASKLELIRDNYFDTQWGFFEPQRIEKMGVTRKEDLYVESLKKSMEASKKIRNEIPKIISEVANEFRNILGVD